MKRIRMILLAGLTTLFFVACNDGGSSSGSDTTASVELDNSQSVSDTTAPVELDNSQLAEDENEFGFFGEEVMFGDHKIVGKWKYTFEREVYKEGLKEDETVFEFHADGIVAVQYNFESERPSELDDTKYDRMYEPVDLDYGVANTKEYFVTSETKFYYITEKLNPSCYQVKFVWDGEIKSTGSFCKL